MRILVAAAVAPLVLGGAVVAATAQTNESFTTSQCWVSRAEMVTLSDERFAYVFSGTGTLRSDTEPFDGLASRCVGLANTFGDSPRESGYCEYLDADGDRFIASWSVTAPGQGEWRFVDGTGKFEGIAGEGTYQSVGAFPSFEPREQLSCIETTGTYSLSR